ncbi:MAG: YqgE/AlgH family protein [Bacteroidales bacterium]|nr:YqgE/AlgH family protein [Bacteroidales bacterium]
MDLNYDFFDNADRREPKKGRILIAEPFLQDVYFKRSIVLLTEHNEEGTVGFVLNKPVDMKVSDVINDFPKIDIDLSIGGPVATNTLHYIHTLGNIIPNSMKVVDNIYWGGDFEVIRELITKKAIKKDQIKFFLGYSGWKANQLENELKEQSWLVVDMKPQIIMTGDLDSIWKDALSNLGDKYKIWINSPESPSLN